MKEVKSPKKPLLYYYLIITAAILIFNLIFTPLLLREQVKDVDYGTFMSMIEKKEIGEVQVEDSEIIFTDKDNANIYSTGAMDDPTLTQRLYESGAKFTKEVQQTTSPLVSFLLTTILPLLIFIGIGQYLSKKLTEQMGGKNSMIFGSAGKSNARVYVQSTKGIHFSDVAGEDEAKESLSEIVDYLHNPEKYTEAGASMPKGILLVGPPGTGKTMLAKAVAGEANVPFFSISGSEFVEMFVGMGAAKVRDLFQQANEKAPCIVFIDEIDTIGKKRDAGGYGGNDEREQTLNQLLTEMDGFDGKKGVVILAATNRPESLDPALLRPGRFDRQITVNYPDVAGREAILAVHCRNKKLAADVDLKTIARRTPFFTGADLENLLNEAAILTARARAQEITQRTIMDAITRVEMGPEKRSRRVTEKDKRIVAYHEAGHALVGLNLPKADDVSMVTIVPRGSSGGHTQFLPSEESDFISREQILSRITVAMGGRAAEALIIEDVTTGASADLQSATELARRMVAQFGMDDVIGPVYHGGNTEVFLGRDFAQSRDCSEKVAAQIDEEIRKVASACQERAINILKANMDKLHRIADVLLDRETITKPELDAIMKGEALPDHAAQSAETKAQPETAEGEAQHES